MSGLQGAVNSCLGENRMAKQLQNSQDEPFFLTEKAEVEMIAVGYEFEPPLIAVRCVCTMC